MFKLKYMYFALNYFNTQTSIPYAINVPTVDPILNINDNIYSESSIYLLFLYNFEVETRISVNPNPFVKAKIYMSINGNQSD